MKKWLVLLALALLFNCVQAQSEAEMICRTNNETGCQTAVGHIWFN